MGKSGSGSSCWGTTAGAAKPARLEDLQRPRCRRRRAAGCRRCRGRAAPSRGQVRDGVVVAVDDRPRRAPCRRPRAVEVADGADGGDARGDLRVGGRHDLAAVAEVDLVAVVLRRVVARGHHHAGDAAELADRVGQQGRGQRPGKQQRPEPGAGHHLGGVGGEDVGVVAGVVADDDGAAGGGAGVAEVRRQAGRRAEHHDAVHPVGAGAEGAAESGGAELQRAGEAVGQVVVGGTALDRRDDRLELSPRRVVGVVLGPGAGPGEQSVVHPRTVSPRRTRPAG